MSRARGSRSRERRQIEPVVALAETFALQAVLAAAILGSMAAGWLPPLWLVVVINVAQLVALALFVRWRFRRVARKPRNSGATVGAIPVVLASVSLFVYAAVLAVVHVHLSDSASAIFDRQSAIFDRQSAAYLARLHAASARETVAERDLKRLSRRETEVTNQLTRLRRVYEAKSRELTQTQSRAVRTEILHELHTTARAVVASSRSLIR